MRYTANQPLYFPAVYMLERFAHVDHLVVMMEAQFSKFGHQSRADIATKNGIQRLILPLQGRDFRPLDEILIDNPEFWLKKLGKTLESVYGKSPYYKEYGPDLLEALDRRIRSHGMMITQANICNFLMMWACTVCRIPIEWHYSTQLLIKRPEDPNEWIIALGSAINCTTYLGGKTAYQNYMDQKKWDDAGISIEVQDYVMPQYKNLAGVELDGNIAFIDPLFMGGPELIRELIGLK